MSDRIVTTVGSAGRVIVARLLPSTNLMAGIKAVCEKHNLKNGIIASGIGSLKTTKYLDPVPKPEIRAKYGYGEPMTAEGPIELLALAGTVCHADDGGILIHAHATMCLADGKAFGGHLTDDGNEILLTGDIVLNEVNDVDFVRRHEEETGMFMFAPTQR